MADLRTYIDANFKEPTVTVRVDGKKLRNVISVDLTYSINNSISTANIVFATSPPLQPESKVTISQGYNGKEALVFTGLVDSIQKTEYASTWTVACRDMLKKALDTFLVQRVKFGIDVSQGMFYYSTYVSDPGNAMNNGQFQVHEYTSLDEMHAEHPETVGNITHEGVKAEAVVQWMLHMSGLTEGTEVQVDDANFFIGDIAPVDFIATSVYDAISQICDLINWYVYCDVGGVTRFKKRPRTSSGYSVWDYDTKRKYNVLSTTFDQSNTDLRNYVEVHGCSGIKVVKRAGSPYLGNTPYRGVLMANELIDTSGMATFIAERVLNDLNRLKEGVSLQVDGNPYLAPGQSVRLDTQVARGTYLIQDLSSSMSAEDGYKTSIQAATYPGDVTPEDDGDITAAFTILQVVSIGDPTYLVLFDGAASYSNRGPVISWDWSFPNTTDNYAGGSSQVWASFEESTITGGNSANVTLTVYDQAGNTDTLVSGITLAALVSTSPIMYRHLYAALTTKGVGSQDGGATWNTVGIPAVSVAASNFAENSAYVTTGYALFGGTDGKIYKTEDIAQSVRDVADLGGTVEHVYIAEMDSSKCLACSSTGDLYRSDTSGESWELVHNFGQPVLQAEYGYKDFSYINVVTAGNNPGIYVSVDGGATFMHLSDFGDKEENWYAGGSQTPYYAYDGGVDASVPHPSGLAFAGGATPDVVAMTVDLDDNLGVMAVDSTGQHWNLVSGLFNPTQSNYSNQTRHMVRDGDIPPLVYYATVEGVYKSLDRNESILPMLTYSGEAKPASPPNASPSSGWGEMVAYGPLAPIVPPVFGRIVLHHGGNIWNSGANDGLLYSFSGYAATGIPVYNRADLIDGGDYSILLSGGLCRVDPHFSSDGTYAYDLQSPASVGPSYFIVFGDRDPEAVPLPEHVGALDYHSVLYAIDFTNSVSPSGTALGTSLFYPKFYPKFYPVKWSSRMLNSNYWDEGWTVGFGTDFARVARNPLHNLAGSAKTRVYLGSSANLVSSRNFVEAVDIPQGALQAGQTLQSIQEPLEIEINDGWDSQIKASNVSRADTLLCVVEGNWLLSDDYHNPFLLSYNAAGVPSYTLGERTVTPSEDSYRVELAPKFSTGWRALGYTTASNTPVLIEGPNKITPIAIDDGTGVVSMHSSAAVQSDMFVATKQGFYRIPAYGQFGGMMERLYEVPASIASGYIHHAAVTHNREFTRDFIVLVVRRPSTYNPNNVTDNVVWSVDNGLSWQYSPELDSGGINGAWWIDP